MSGSETDDDIFFDVVTEMDKKGELNQEDSFGSATSSHYNYATREGSSGSIFLTEYSVRSLNIGDEDVGNFDELTENGMEQKASASVTSEVEADLITAMNVAKVAGAEAPPAKLAYTYNSPYGLKRLSSAEDLNVYGSVPGSNFRVRGANYLEDGAKVESAPNFLQLVSCELFTSSNEIWHTSDRPDSYVNKSREAGDTRFKLVVVFVTPTPPHVHLLSTFAAPPCVMGGEAPPNAEIGLEYDESHPVGRLFRAFVDGDDDFRNNRFKIIPQVISGSWMVSRAVGTRPAILGTKLEMKYFRGDGYLEMDCNIGSSSVAQMVTGVCVSYMSALVIDLGIVIQGNEEDELPEGMLGGVRLQSVDLVNCPLV